MIEKAVVLSRYDQYTLNKKESWNILNDISQKDDLALCVGAGVTRSFVGEWNDLLNELAIMRIIDTLAQEWISELNNNDINNLRSFVDDHFDGACKGKACPFTNEHLPCIYLDKSKKCKLHKISGFFPIGMNTLEQGEYLKDGVPDNSYSLSSSSTESYKPMQREFFFAAQVRQAIERCINKKTKGEALESYFLANIKTCGMSTLREVIKLCLTGKIEHVITYNFDTILERLLRCDKVCEAVLEGSSESGPGIRVYAYNNEPIGAFSKDRIKSEHVVNIYHVHGIAYEDEYYSTRPLIFSENSYLEYQRNLLNWSNLRIADVISRSHLLCVGFSGADPNFRMLNRVITDIKKNPLFTDPSPAKNIWLTQTYNEYFMSGCKVGDYLAYSCFKAFTDSAEEYFDNSFGITILWSESHKDIAKNLDDISRKLTHCI